MNKKALQVATAVICTLTLFFVGYFLMQANSARAAELVSWTDFYQIIAFVGAVVGFSISASWGGFQSTLGRSLFFISLGLFFQNIGQTIYSIYGLIFHISNIYPSYADIGFFDSRMRLTPVLRQQRDRDALRAALANLEQWANKGIAPPRTPRIKLDASLEIVRDQDGNTLGGLRLAYIDVPTAHYVGALAPAGMLSIVGDKAPFDHARLTALYGDHAGYVRRFSAATDVGLAARLILPDDARDMKAAAAEATVP